MADNVTVNAMSGGDTIAADDISGVKFQRVKITWGADGVANETTSATPLPITMGASSVNVASASTVGMGATSVPTAGTAVRLPAQVILGVTVRAMITNTGTIYVGGSGVTSTNGFPLVAGESINLDVANLNAIYINASVNNDSIRYVWVG